MTRFVWTLISASAALFLLLAGTTFVGRKTTVADEESIPKDYLSASRTRELQPAETLGIFGRVLEDINDDGIGDVPMSGVTVDIRLLTDDGFITGTNTSSNSEGFYFLSPNLFPPGEYNVSITSSNLEPFSTFSSVPEAYRGTSDGTDTFSSGPYDFVVTTRVASQFSGFVWENNMINEIENDIQLQGVNLILTQVNGSYSASTISDSGGFYSFVGFPVGNFNIYIDSEEYYDIVPPSYTLSFVDDSQPFISEGNDFFVNRLTFDVSGAILVDINRTGNDLQPLRTGVVVFLNNPPSFWSSTVSDSDGVYSFIDVPVGNYGIFLQRYIGSNPTSQRVTLDASQPTVSDGNDFVINTFTFQVSGTLIWDDVSDTNDDFPLLPITVILEGPDYVLSTLSDGDGFYSFIGVRPGNYSSYIIINDDLVSMPQSYTLTLDDSQPAISDGNDFFVNKRLTFEVSGTIFLDVNRTGNDVQPIRGGVRVFLSSPFYSATTLSSTIAGTYSFVDVPVGTYRISLQENIISDPASRTLILDESHPAISDGYNFFVTKWLTFEVSGTILVDVNRTGNDVQPIRGGMRVFLSSPFYPKSTLTDSVGVYSFVDVPVGTYRIGIQNNIVSDPTSRTLTLDDSQPTVSDGNDFVIDNFTFQVSGNIVREDANGADNDLQSVYVNVRLDSTSFSTSTSDDSDGFYSFVGIPSGNYSIYIQDLGDPFTTNPPSYTLILDDSGPFVSEGNDFVLNPIGEVTTAPTVPVISVSPSVALTLVDSTPTPSPISATVACLTTYLEEGVDYRIVPRHDNSLALSIQGDSIVLRAKETTGKDQIWSPRRVGSEFYHFINAGENAPAINVAEASVDSKADIIPWPLSTPNSDNDDWCLQSVTTDADSASSSSDYFYLIASHVLQAGGNAVMDVVHAGRSEGTNIVQYARRSPGVFHQQFQFEKVVPETCKVCVSPESHEATVAGLQTLVDDLTSQLTELGKQHDDYKKVVDQRLSVLEGSSSAKSP